MKVLYVLFVLDTLNLAVYLPVFSAFVRSLGGSPFTLGLINSSSAFITLFWNLIVGSLSDQIGRKALLWKCMIASSVGSLILCFSCSSLTLVFLGKLVAAFGSPIVTLLRSTVADVFKTDEEKKLFLNKSAPFMSLAFLVGSLSSGFLSEAKNGFSLAFLLMAFLMGSASLITLRTIPDDPQPKSKTKKDINFVQRAIQELKVAALNIRTISWPRYLNLFIMKGLYDFSLVTILTNIGLVLLNEYGIQGRHVGYIFFTTTVFSIIANVLKLKLHNFFAKIPDDKKIIGGGLILLISFLGMSLSSSVFMFVLFICITCVSRTFMEVFFVEMITTKSQEEDRGRVFAAFEMSNPFMSIIVPVLSGLVAKTCGVRIVLFSATIPIFLAILVALRQKNKTE